LISLAKVLSFIEEKGVLLGRSAMELKKMMIVEDSDLLHKVYDVLLTRYKGKGVKVLHSYNGQEALTLLAGHPDVNLILLDINMPVMSGLEFLGHLKAHEAFKDIRVIVISTEGKEDDTRRAIKAGATGYVTKPFQAQDIHRIIDKVMAEG
jgi:two-component system, chemotaxis family, chemotaxis protein CheY